MFGQPFALLGLALAALPILAHLLSRRSVRPRLFPSLRFVPRSRVTPVRVATPTDLPLLFLRILVIVLATLAFARPQWRVGGGAAEGDVARVIVVDSSRSMHLQSTVSDSISTGFAVAQGIARALADSVQHALVLSAEHPVSVLSAAAEWLDMQAAGSRKEIVVVSDLQRFSTPARALRGIPAHIGISVRRVELSAEPEKSVSRGTLPELVAGNAPALLAARTIVEQARVQPVVPLSVVFADEASLDDIAARISASGNAEAIRYIARLSNNDELQRVATRGRERPGESLEGSDTSSRLVVARNAAGNALVTFGVDSSRARHVLLVRDSIASRLGAAVLNALLEPDLAASLESDRVALSDAEVTALTRVAPPVVRAEDSPWVQRLLWLLALAALGVEQLKRRRQERAVALPDETRLAA